MIELKDFQEKAVDSLVSTFRKLTERPEASVSIFKAPTGSGKTIMMAEFLKRQMDEDTPNEYVFVWASLYEVAHLVVKEKIAFIKSRLDSLRTLSATNRVVV